jgi:hypothetical protein
MLDDVDPIGGQKRLSGVIHGVIDFAGRIRGVSAFQQVFGHFEGMVGFTEIPPDLIRHMGIPSFSTCL